MPEKKKYEAIRANPVRLAIYLEQKRKWKTKNKQRFIFRHFSSDFKVRKKVNIPATFFWGLAKRQKLICALSGRKLTSATMSIDHIVPLSKGGTNAIENLQFVHVDVNYAKRSMSDANFIQLCKEVVAHANERNSKIDLPDIQSPLCSSRGGDTYSL